MLANRYDIKDVIGAGGMGMVYLGQDTKNDEPVAIKLLKAEAVRNDPDMLERFIREGEALRQLNHPSIVKVLDTVEKDDSHFIIMEYVSGGSLKSLMSAQPKMPIKRALEITLDIADALTRAHRLKIIHRDIKPANVLMAEDGTPRLADFGVAYIEAKERVTQSGIAMGTTDYICPEALNGDQADVRADIWSLGVMLFEMLAGQRPFRGETTTQVLIAIMTDVTPDLEELRPDCPVELADLIYRMLEKDRDARIPSVRLVGAEIEAMLLGLALDTSNMRPMRFPVLGPNNDPPTAPLHPVRNNLPAQTGQFVGREPEIEEISRLIADNSIRLVTILAPGGMGKTRLSLEVAERQLDHFPDGVFFVQLAPINTVDAVIPALAEAIKYQFLDDGRSSLQQICDYLRHKTTLLVMDNFEHVLDGADVVKAILEAAPLIEIVVTSRTRLNLRSETVFPLDGMSVPEWDSTEDALQYSAVKLFMQSARREDPGFELHDADLRHVAQICRLLQGMPLGILLAAAWVDTLSLPEIADEISRSLDFLESNMRDLPERHQSIRAVFDYSWTLLVQKEREAFARLSVFRGGFSRQAAQEVTGASLRTLMALVDKSLLRRDPSTGRYEIHELLRQYAAEQLEATGESTAIRDAHLAYYTTGTHQRESDLKGRRQLAALNEIEQDFDNGRAAWDWALENGYADSINRVIESLYLFCNMRSRWQNVDDMFLKAIERFAPRLGEEPKAVWGRLLARYFKQHTDRAWVKKALEIARQYDDQAEIAFCLYAKGWVLYDARQYDEAVAYYEQSLELFKELEDDYYVAIIYSSLGVWYSLNGQPERGMIYFHDSLELRRKVGDRVGMADSLHNIGAPLIFKGALSEAEKYTQEAHDISHETGSLSDIAFSGATLAGLALWRGDLQGSRTLIEQSLQIASDIHYDNRRGYALAILGNLACVEGDYRRARQLCEEARPLSAANPLVAYIADVGLANAACGLEDYAAARKHLQLALPTVHALNNVAFMTACLPAAAMIMAPNGHEERAVELIALALKQPQVAIGWLKKWPLLAEFQVKLKASLGDEVYQAAWTRGQGLDIEAVVAELLKAKV